MSTTIDSKVVEMKFDNSKFESNVKQTMSTLDKLKASLAKISGKHATLDVDTSGTNKGILSIGNAVDSVSSKFNALEAVAFGALAKIGSQALVAGENLVKSLSVDNIATGWSKYDEKTSSVQTLVNSTGKSVEEINKYLDQLMWYSDETSYSFTEMTAALAAMTSTGGDIDKLIPAITGIANATAFAGKSGEAFNHTIRNITQSYNAGFLQLMDWKSLNLAGTSSKQLTEELIKAAEEIGTVQKGYLTLENFAESLRYKFITTDVMDLAFSRFSAMSEEAYKLVQAGKFETASEAIEAISDNFDELSKRAFQSAQEAKTFKEAIDATKDAVSSGWMETFEIIFGNYEQAKELWTDIANRMWDFFAGGAGTRNQKLTEIFGTSWDNLTGRITEAGVSAEEFNTQLERVVTESGLNIDSIKTKYGSLSEWMMQSNGKYNHYIKDTLASMAYSMKDIDSEFKVTTEDVKKFDEIIEKLASGKFKKAIDAENALTKVGFGGAQAQEMLNHYFETGGKNVLQLRYEAGKLKETIIDLSKSQVSSYGYTKEQLEALKELSVESRDADSDLGKLIDTINRPASGRQLLLESLFNVLDSFEAIVATVKDAFSEIFPPTSASTIYEIIKAISELTEKMKDFFTAEENVDKLTRTFKGLFAILDIIKTVVLIPINIALGVFKALMGESEASILDFTAKVGDNIVAFRDWIKEHDKTKEILEWLIPKVQKAKEVFNDLTREGGLLNNIYKNMSKYLTDIKNSFGVWLQGLIESEDKPRYIIDSLTAAFREGIPMLIKAGGEAIKELIKAIKAALKDKGSDFLGSELLGSMVDGFKNSLSTMLDSLTDFGSKVMEKLRSLPWAKIFAVGMSLGLVKSLLKVTDAFTTLKDKVGGFIESAGDAIASIGKAAKREALGDMALKFAQAIAIIVGCIVVLTLVDADKAWNATAIIATIIGTLALALTLLNVSMMLMSTTDPKMYVAQVLAYMGLITAIGIFIVAIGGIMILLGKAGDITQGIEIVAGIFVALLVLIGAIAFLAPKLEQGTWAIGAMAVFIKALASFMLYTAISMKIVGSMDEQAFNRASGFFAGMMAFVLILLVVSAAMKTVPMAMEQFGKGMASIGTALILTAIAMKIVGSMDEDALKKGYTFLVSLGVFIGLMMYLTKNISYRKAMVEFGKMMIELGASLMLTAVAFKIIGSMSDRELIRGIAFLGGFLAFTALMAKATKAGGKTIKDFGKLMISLGAALFLMSVSVKLIGDMDVTSLAKGITAVALLALIMSKMANSFRGFESKAMKVSAALLACGACIAIMAFIAFLLGQMEVTDLAKGISAVAILAVLMDSIILAAKGMGASKNLVELFTKFAILIAVITACMLLLTIPDYHETLAAAGGLSAVMLALTVMLAVAGKMKVSKTATRAFVAMGLLLTEMVGLLVILSKFGNAQAMVPSAIALSTLVIALSAAMKVISGVKAINKSVIGTLALLGLIIGELGLIVGGLEKLGISVSIQNAVALGLLVDSLSVALLPLTLVGSFATAALSGIAVLETLILATTGVVALIGGLFEELDFDMSTLDKGIEVLTKVGEAIGGVVGGIVTGFGEEVLTLLPTAGQALSKFYANATPFINGMTNLDPAVTTGAENLASAILKLTAGEALQLLLAAFTGQTAISEEALKQSFTAIGEGVKAFAESVSGFTDADVTAIDKAASAAKGLTDFITSLPTQGGWKQKILGEQDLAKFSENLKAFGVALKDFSLEARYMDTGAITRAAEAAQGLADFANALPEYTNGTLKGFALGDKATIQEFGQQLWALADGLCNFYNRISGDNAINNNVVRSATTSAKGLAELASELPATDGKIAEWFGGTMDLQTFGSQLSALGQGLSDFSTSAKGIILECMNRAVTAVQDLANIAISLSGADFSVFGNDTIGALGEQLPGLGQALVSFNTSIATLSGGAASNMGYAITNLGNLANAIVQFQGINYEYIYSFKDALNSLAEFDMQGLVNTFTVEGIEQVGTAGKKISDSIIEGLKKGDEGIKKTASMLMTSILNEIHVMYHYFHDTGYEITEQMRSGIRMGEAGLVYETKGVVNSAQRSINDYYPHFVAVGEHLMNGLHDGLANQEDTVVGKAQEIAAKVLEVMKQTTEINSPSKATERMGRYLDEGLINGMKKYSRQVYSTAETLSTKTLDGFSKSIDQIYEVIDADLNPVITPTINLDYVKQGVSDINSMFNAKSLNANAELQNGVDMNGAGGPTISFTQINNSPKALSRIDIYRQTRNQIAQMKGALN